jgi:SAM-dependent methyltransferase
VRDTDRDWDVLGEREPFFGVLAEDRFRVDRLDEAAVEAFYETGRVDVEYIVSVAERTVGVPTHIRTICDFGGGVGRLSFALSRYGEEVIAVDVSPGMREKGMQRAAQLGVDNVRFEPAIPEGDLDWVNSLIVFQHIPPARGIELLEALVSKLRPGGLLTVQLTYAHDNRHLGELIAELGDYSFDGQTVRRMGLDREEPAGVMRMYDYDLSHVFRVLHRHGLASVWTEHTDHGGCHGVRLFARAPG